IGLVNTFDTTALFVVLVGRDRQPFLAGAFAQKRQCGVDFGRAAGSRGFGIHDQGMTIIGQHVADITQLGWLPLGFLVQPGIRVGLAFVGVRAALLALEIRRSVGWVA